MAALLALSGCRTPKTAAQEGAPARATETAPTVPPAPATQPTPTPAPAPPVIAPEKPAPAPPSAPPAAKPSTPKAAAAPKQAAPQPAAPAPNAQSAPAAAKPSSLDLNSLEQRLKDTRAIGVFTKLSLKNQVDDLLDDLRAFHKGAAKTPQSELRQKYDLLIMKVLSLLQNGDPQLASAIASSREALWGILMDPQKFANI